MFRSSVFTALFASLFLVACSGDDTSTTDSSTPAEPAAEQRPLDKAMSAMGMDGLNAITWSGTAWRVRNSFRQTYTASPPWPERDEITNYTRTLDLSQPASLATGETFASNLFLEPPVEGTYTQNVPATQDAWGQQLEIWLTPWGFLHGADLYGASAETDADGQTVLSWQSPTDQTSPSGMRYTVNGYIDEDGLVTQVETWVEDAFMGDMHVVALYSDYSEMDGVMVPATMEQQRGGGGVFGVDVSDARVNPADLAQLMQAPESGGGGFPGGGGGGPATPASELIEEIDEGVYLVTGGYVALVVEFEDYVAVFEAGQSETRGEQILEAVKSVVGDKQIRYLINSHPHADHTAGIVPFVREGATIATHANNVEFLEMALSTPRTLLGEDTLSPRFRPIEGVGVMEDDSMRLELHHIPNLHSDGTLVALLPEQGILFQADFTLPVPGAEANPFVVDLAEYVAENELDFEHYLAVHAAAEPQTKADLMATIDE